jgi:hypothetical protein
VGDEVMARSAIPVKIRAAVRARDGEKCTRCEATEDLALHHILPVSEGGKHRADNLVTACWTCHKQMHVERGDWYAGKMLGKKPDWMQGKQPHTIKVYREFWLDLVLKRKLSFTEMGVLSALMGYIGKGSQYVLDPKTRKPANISALAKLIRVDRSGLCDSLKRLGSLGLITQEKVGKFNRIQLNPDMVSYN